MKPLIKYIKNNWFLILTIIVLVIYSIIYHKISENKISHLSKQNNIYSVQADSLKIYKNKLDEVTYEKQSLILTNKDIKNNYDLLDKNNKELVNKIKVLEKEEKVVSATNIDQTSKLDSIVDNHPANIDTVNSLINFVKDEKFLKYNITVNTKTPSLLIQSLEQPNKLFLTYAFNDKGVSVKVTNSNPAYSVNNISSYIIPIEKPHKFKTAVRWGTIGIGVGIVGTLFLLK